ncbi:MAG: hypothetical protein B6D72_20195 [gamma proteobacterium symbiont of Ctena orbiculata]|uniref:Uncharacterized protein n=1 Tax=Candidatus Thiodiazotropha taylori TaxID=2792791 RepID=A0A944QVR7_9GAMM|nr:hypothetical protein [Candidatus Thiodiazotropha taylori]PUB86943.1 MAG: hypothetical protein DBP00_10285 [gamma proteobacterium symbiont of Ctena orbiculata]MBT2989656.1 hypothetical protein [Candidatus Thiodiazotropha taylori]MBT2996005.1 hypothetical protein [Candidatus Thiodiazotropha taylori]MBT3001627.1 hypothetical protein [Candidatus Thiodiazotropha taylori]
MATRYARTTCGIRILLKYNVFPLFVMFLFSQFSVAEEDPYLSAISSEAEKVESTETTISTETSEDEETDGPSLQAFEEDLKARYMGSFTFYKKLPRRSREEVFEEYKGGASIDEIRKKIMDRFLNQ